MGGEVSGWVGWVWGGWCFLALAEAQGELLLVGGGSCCALPLLDLRSCWLWLRGSVA
eukprot:COSAG02_NODE_309_length_25051_cov_5.385460_8_plen_57_part_00